MKLTILFGGASFEHEISIVSAITVKGKLKSFDLDFIFCDQDHKFYLIDSKDMKAKFFSSGDYKKSKELHIELYGFAHKKLFSNTKLDAPILNLIHGGDGEDGSIASLLDFYKIAFIGPRKEACTFSFDKYYTKLFAESVGVKSVDYELIEKDGDHTITIPFPIIIKPATLGSSIGVSIVKENSELAYALDVAFEFDTKVIVEPFVVGVKEYNLAGYGKDNSFVYSVVEEPQKNEFLDFDKKYMDFSRSSKVSEATLDELMVKKLQNSFSKIYGTIFNGSLIRCDFFIIDETIYLNEINPIPGSMANYLFSDFEEVIKDLLSSIPRKSYPKVDYQYIHSISRAKGK